jgi:hypothetical protein
MLYVGLDIHDKRITICVLRETGQIVPRSHVRTIDEMMRILEALPDRFEVCYEPNAEGSELGLVKKPPKIRPGLSFEHADVVADKIYWVVRYKRSRKPSNELKQLTSIPGSARRVGFEEHRLSSNPSEDLRAETDPWFTNPDYDFAWYEVFSEEDRVGYHVAVLVCIGSHLRWHAGPRMNSVYMVAQIEGKPNPRRNWSRRV